MLLDAFLVRLLLVPVLLRLAGPPAWYLPSWLERVLPKVHFGHGHPASGSSEAAEAGAKPSAPVPVG